MALYHAQTGFPVSTRFPKGIFPLRYSQHALREARADRYGNVEAKLPYYLNVDKAELVEAKIDSVINKMVYRVKLDAERDLCLVVVPDRAVWTVKTIWINESSDCHSTLNISKYERVSA